MHHSHFAKQIYDVSLQAVNLIDQRIEDFNIECDKKNGGIHAATSTSKMKEYEEDLMWLEKGVYVKAMADNAEATSLIAAEQYKMGSTLINAGMGYAQHKHSMEMAEKYGIG